MPGGRHHRHCHLRVRVYPSVAEHDIVEQQTIALAGLFQAVALTCQCARQGRVEDPAALATSLHSLLQVEAQDAELVYGDRTCLALGLRALAAQLARIPNAANSEPARYVASLLYLERRLCGQPPRLARLAEDIAGIRDRQIQNAITDPPMLREFAQIYSAHISPLGPKLMINGEPGYLRDADIAACIRALLLAGVRSAVLWRQWGGTRLRMHLFRGRYRRCTRVLLESIQTSDGTPT